MHTITTKTEELHTKKKDIAAEVLSVTNKLEKDLIVNEIPDNDEGESALDIYCKNAEKVKKHWMGRIQGIITKMTKNQLYFSKNITAINRKEEEVESTRPKTAPASPTKSISNARHFKPMKLKFTCNPEDWRSS